MTIVYVPATIVGGSGGPDKASVPVWLDGNQGVSSGAYITNGTSVSVPDTNQLTATERKAWVSYKDNKIWYCRIKTGATLWARIFGRATERWIEWSHIKLAQVTPPQPSAEHYHEFTVNGVVVKTTGAKV